jgi:hypothetical protein
LELPYWEVDVAGSLVGVESLGAVDRPLGGFVVADRLLAVVVGGGNRLEAVAADRHLEEDSAVDEFLEPYLGACLEEFGQFGSCWLLAACVAAGSRPGQTNVAVEGMAGYFGQGAG